MATLKVYSREYGTKTIKEKVKLTKIEWFVYTVIPAAIVASIYIMLNYYSITYSLKHEILEKEVIVNKMSSDNEEQRVLINDLSSYERIKKIAEVLGMEANKDNVKVVR